MRPVYENRRVRTLSGSATAERRLHTARGTGYRLERRRPQSEAYRRPTDGSKVDSLRRETATTGGANSA